MPVPPGALTAVDLAAVGEAFGREHARAYGHRAVLPAVEPMTGDTVFDAASLTKVIACAPAVMLLVERGQVALDAPLHRYLPEFRGDGREALDLALRHRPDAAILDIMMPDISGLDVLRFMREDPQLAKIPVIVVSAKSMPADIKMGLEAGASVYLTKPVGYLDLKDAVEKVLGLGDA